MKWLVYALFRGATSKARMRSLHKARMRSLHGPDARPVEIVTQNDLCAAVSPADDAPIAPTVERILDYERVVEALFRKADLIPMRFGSILESDEAVAGFLRQRAAHVRDQLRAIDGCVEMGVRVVAGQPRAPKTRNEGQRQATTSAKGPGRAYLQSRARHLGPDEGPSASLEEVDRCREAVRGLYTQAKVGAPASLKVTADSGGAFRLAYDPSDTGISLSFLVPRKRLAAFRRALGALGKRERMTCPVSGPWPPYSFVTG